MRYYNRGECFNLAIFDTKIAKINNYHHQIKLKYSGGCSVIVLR